MKISRIFLELLFPQHCPVCDCVLPLGEKICPDCRLRLRTVQEPYCRKCGKELSCDTQEYCEDCMKQKHLFDEGRALYEYPCIRRSIAAFKYKGRQEYAEFYAQEIEKHLGETIRRWQPQALIPVPLHPSRMRARGYNQAFLLAKELGERMGIPVAANMIKRVKRTAPQKALNRQMRQNNLKRAFKIGRNDVKLSTIIIIDDIYTTGSTMDAMAAVLRDAGIRRIYFITLAIGRG